MIKVSFIVEPKFSTTGLSRYTETLIKFINKHGAVESTIQDTKVKFPGFIAKPAKHFGYDVERFMGHYPLRVPRVEADLTHLTTESLATILRFQTIEGSIVTLHGLMSYVLRKDPELTIKTHFLDYWLEDISIRALGRASHLISVSQYLADYVIEKLNIPPEKVSVVYHGIEHDVFYKRELPTEFYAKHNLNPEHRYIIYTGSEQPRKNFVRLVDAFSQVYQDFPNVYLLKVGQPEIMAEREKATRLIKERQLGDRVRFMGHIEGDLALFYNLANIFVFPSRYEGFGLPPLEAMACGAPVISSAATSLAEVVGDGALIFDPLNTPQLVEALRLLLTNEEERQALRERGLKRAQQFTWDKTATETLAVYEKVLGHRKASQ